MFISTNKSRLNKYRRIYITLYSRAYRILKLIFKKF